MYVPTAKYSRVMYFAYFLFVFHLGYTLRKEDNEIEYLLRAVSSCSSRKRTWICSRRHAFKKMCSLHRVCSVTCRVPGEPCVLCLDMIGKIYKINYFKDRILP